MFWRKKSHRNRALYTKLGRRRGRLLLEGLEERRLMATFQVLNNNDSGNGSLRAAIISANANSGKDTIEFAIAGTDQKINLQSVLPGITDPVVIDATTQPGFVDRPLVQIDGSAISANTSAGLFITGGDSTVRGLSITNFVNGIFIENLGGNKIEGNLLGLSLSGATAGNRANGIILKDSPGNTIGGSAASQRNVLSGNAEFGVRVQGSGTTNTLIQGNFIGTDVSGSNARPNLLDGVLVDSASGTIIGTDGNGVGDFSERNVISGNAGRGIRLFNTRGNAIAGNLIGVAPNGSLALPNGTVGISVDGGSIFNRIGTNGDGSSDALEKNVISGNSRGGVELFDASSNIIAGNYVGTSADGLQNVRNVGIGLFLQNSSNNRIGTNADGVSDFQELNLISGNEFNAIQLSASDFNVVAGNWLGLSSDGETPIANGHSGVWIYAGSSDNRIGTNDDGVRDDVERNVIAGNRLQGVSIDGTYDGTSKTEKNVVAGNFIGTDKTGSKAVANETGVYIHKGASSNIVGTTASSRAGSAAGNVIAGNQFNGILIRYQGTTGNQVAGNLIGISADGMHPIGNNHAGVTIAEGPTGNFVGGASPKQANYIGANKNQGIWIVDDSANNSVDGNYIGLASDRVTPMANGANGVLIQNSSQSRIGAIAANTIAQNTQSGIAVTLNTSTRNEFSRNVIYGNKSLGIDLGNDGPTSNDANDVDVGPNQLQNFPVLVSAATTGSKIQIAGRLASAPNTTYRIEYFAKVGVGDAIDSMEYLGSGTVVTDRSGQVNWVFELNGSATTSQSIIATATSSLTGTSEFSESVPVQELLPVTIGLVTARENVGTVQATVSRGVQSTGTPLTIALSSSTPSLAQVPATVDIPAGQSSVTFNITIVNDTVWKVNQAAILTARLGSTRVGSASIAITDDDSPWHNFDIAFDVSGDGKVTPTDVLRVINFLNASRGGSIYELSQPTNGLKLFADVNNDERISPIDALIVINQLNSRGNAEGEAKTSAIESNSQPAASMVDLAILDVELIKRRR